MVTRALSLLGVRPLTRGLALLACAAATAMSAAPAPAEGTVTIQQTDGTINTYKDAKIKVIHNALYITSKDGNGTMIVTKAACSYQENVLTCFPLAVSLVQPGETGAIPLLRGTIYTNTSGQRQQLPYSSVTLPPRGLVLSFTTKRGTLINVTGVIDGESK